MKEFSYILQTPVRADQRSTPARHLQCNSVQNEHQQQRDLQPVHALKSVTR